MTPEASFAKKNRTNGNGNGNGSHEVARPRPLALPEELQWHIRRDMPRPQKKEPRKKP
ncbi:MAG TPA: hypothetical protein VJ481_03245 [Patescibacteria group bacterium]|nr:hypothetical protein [Patescibacteria group bacterium]